MSYTDNWSRIGRRVVEKIVLLYTQACEISSICEMDLMVELRLR